MGPYNRMVYLSSGRKLRMLGYMAMADAMVLEDAGGTLASANLIDYIKMKDYLEAP